MANLNSGDLSIGFTLPGVDGNIHALSDYNDKKAVAVIFTCNHCPYAQAYEGRLIEVQKDYASKGVQLIAINANDAEKHPSDSFEAMKQRSQEKGFPYPYLYDESQKTARAYGAQRTPEIFLFDQNGKLQYHGAPDDNYENPAAVQQPYLRNALDAVLAGHTPVIADTAPSGCTIKWKVTEGANVAKF